MMLRTGLEPVTFRLLVRPSGARADFPPGWEFPCGSHAARLCLPVSCLSLPVHYPSKIIPPPWRVDKQRRPG